MATRAVLLVDDDENILRFVSLGLRRSGFEVLTANGSKQALELSQQHGFDAVVLDNGLGETSGVELLAELRKSRPELAAIFSSGAITQKLTDEAKRLGAIALEKPYAIRTLVETIESLLARG
jgi:two-component system KDP operon response regulator KdpE